jgi:hypothetical protein
MKTEEDFTLSKYFVHSMIISLNATVASIAMTIFANVKQR